MERYYEFDNLKGFAIILVIFGHALQYVIGTEYAYDNILYRLIYSFHMPLFMMISGFFFYNSLSRSFVEVFKSKFIFILLPCLIWSLVVVLMGG